MKNHDAGEMAGGKWGEGGYESSVPAEVTGMGGGGVYDGTEDA